MRDAVQVVDRAIDAALLDLNQHPPRHALGESVVGEIGRVLAFAIAWPGAAGSTGGGGSMTSVYIA
ncbi:hypothetical protein [Micromonospora zamorensis]|uniref:hypothetical protein n=1 Tax=Micromonospora zamorensis TaxID=709883 RepID=UPI0033C14582